MSQPTPNYPTSHLLTPTSCLWPDTQPMHSRLHPPSTTLMAPMFTVHKCTVEDHTVVADLHSWMDLHIWEENSLISHSQARHLHLTTAQDQWDLLTVNQWWWKDLHTHQDQWCLDLQLSSHLRPLLLMVGRMESVRAWQLVMLLSILDLNQPWVHHPSSSLHHLRCTKVRMDQPQSSCIKVQELRSIRSRNQEEAR